MDEMIDENGTCHLPFPVGDDIDLGKTAENFRFYRLGAHAAENDGFLRVPVLELFSQQDGER